MNVLEAPTGVIFMLHAATLKGVTPAPATPDTRAMGFRAQVNASNWQSYCSMHSDIVMVATTIAVTQMEATCVSAIFANAIQHTNMDRLKSI